MGLLGAVELARGRGARAAAGQGRVQARLGVPPADALDGGDAGVHRLGDPSVRPGRAAGAAVGLEQDAGAGEAAGRGSAGGDLAVQDGAVGLGQADDGLLGHARPSPGDHRRAADRRTPRIPNSAQPSNRAVPEH